MLDYLYSWWKVYFKPGARFVNVWQNATLPQGGRDLTICKVLLEKSSWHTLQLYCDFESSQMLSP
jgi:hypothetical protein